MKRMFPAAGLCLLAQWLLPVEVSAQSAPPPSRPVPAIIHEAPPSELPEPVATAAEEELLGGPIYELQGQVISQPPAPLPLPSVCPPADCTPETCTPDSCTPQTACEGEEECGPYDWLCSDELFLGHLRKQKLTDDITYSIGGQARHRYMDERYRLRPLPGALTRTTYQLHRHNPWFELGYQDLVNVHVEAIDGSSFGSEIEDAPIDVNRSDLLQYYADVNVYEIDGKPVKYRYGRQFLQYGGQHLVSPLAWANIYRNFEGHKLFYTGTDWDVDAFAVQPVNAATNNTPYPTSFDTPDQSRWFGGIYSTYKGLPVGTLDLYWLWLKEDEPRALAANAADGNRHTTGVRYAGKYDVKEADDVVGFWSWDFETAYQFGEDNLGVEEGNVSAGFVSLISGYTWSNRTWSPNLTGVFWWGSGDSDPNDGEINTVSTLFPLGHAFWGQIDNFSGQNLINYSVQGAVNPTKKLNLASHYHWMFKADSSDYTYNILGAALGPNHTDSFLGTELDLLATYQVNKNLQVQAGYFWFFYGEAITETALNRPDAQQFYLMTTWTY